ncbi:MAG: CBS domain-containing protein, partial [Planctomycetes bacterium]|nr:CBS domain-containing protein [Planctomycetota bacterium]
GILPAVMLFDRAAARITGASGSEAFGRDARGRIATLLKEGATLGVLTESQTRLIDRALALRNATIRDEMIPWRSVRCVQAAWDRAALMQHIGATAHARLPVVGADGSVRGVLWNLDAYLDTGENWAALAREPARLGPETTVREALKALGESPARVGIVEQDGRPIGLITGKDLVEPLIGEVAAW